MPRVWTEEQKQAARERMAKARSAKGEKPKEKLDDTYEPKEELVDVHINLAPNAESLTINGMAYWHGKDYKVTPSVARDLNAMAGNTWKHEAQIHGENENQYRRPTHRRLSQGR
ncbi:MAG: hypothetical protein KGH65_05170 [Candidatus Micrarchaeota archaeon]|nr:hypothetical protein [Candidatus Micrarchaeota archaeon]